MILPLLSSAIRSRGWIARLPTRTTSPGLIEEGRRTRPLPMSDTSASAPADGHLHLALHREQRPVALLDDRAYVAGLAEPDGGADRRLAGFGSQRGAKDDRDPVLVGDDVDRLHVVGRRHRGRHVHRDRDDGAVLGDEGHVELADTAAVLHRPRAEDPLERLVDRLVLTERLRVSRARRGQHETAGAETKGPERHQRSTAAHRMILHRSGIIYADVAGLKARGSQSGRLRLPGPGAGRASANQRRYISCDLAVSTKMSPYRSSAPAFVPLTFCCPQCSPETGSGC